MSTCARESGGAALHRQGSQGTRTQTAKGAPIDRQVGTHLGLGLTLGMGVCTASWCGAARCKRALTPSLPCVCCAPWPRSSPSSLPPAKARAHINRGIDSSIHAHAYRHAVGGPSSAGVQLTRLATCHWPSGPARLYVCARLCVCWVWGAAGKVADWVGSMEREYARLVAAAGVAGTAGVVQTAAAASAAAAAAAAAPGLKNPSFYYLPSTRVLPTSTVAVGETGVAFTFVVPQDLLARSHYGCGQRTRTHRERETFLLASRAAPRGPAGSSPLPSAR
jgi:hypothetical protein